MDRAGPVLFGVEPAPLSEGVAPTVFRNAQLSACGAETAAGGGSGGGAGLFLQRGHPGRGRGADGGSATFVRAGYRQQFGRSRGCSRRIVASGCRHGRRRRDRSPCQAGNQPAGQGKSIVSGTRTLKHVRRCFEKCLSRRPRSDKTDIGATSQITESRRGDQGTMRIQVNNSFVGGLFVARRERPGHCRRHSAIGVRIATG